MDDSRPTVSGLKFGDFELALEHSISVVPLICATVLVPVGHWILNEPELISDMTDWRQAAKDNFFARFPASTTSFTEYLKTHSLLKTNVILFMIYSEQVGFKGHLGLTQITARTAEIDAVMLSPSAQGQGLAKASLAALILWAENSLGVDTLTLEVLSCNVPAINLYSKFGFEISTSTALKEVAEGTLKLLVDSKSGEKSTGLCRILMIRRTDKS